MQTFFVRTMKTDKTAHMRRQVEDFVGRTCQKLHLLILRFIFMDSLIYLVQVLSNNLVVHTGSMDGNGQKSVYISVPVTSLMEPYGQLIVYYFTVDGQWNADSTYFSVNDGSAIFKNKVRMHVFNILDNISPSFRRRQRS